MFLSVVLLGALFLCLVRLPLWRPDSVAFFPHSHHPGDLNHASFHTKIIHFVFKPWKHCS